MSDWDKTDIIHFLSDLNRYESYLEICSPSTGGLYNKIDRSSFRRCHRLMYRIPPGFDDQLDINFRSFDARTADLVETIHAFGFRYDIVLVDSFHYYDLSFRDLADAFNVLTPRGSIVVHDCLPTSEELASPDYVPGGWCGVSFIAYIDFVTSGRPLTYTTVDTDYGCGVIRKSDSEEQLPQDLMEGWNSVRHDAKAAYRFMSENKHQLLHLVSVDEFKKFEMGRR
jgi:hypothetical protein